MPGMRQIPKTFASLQAGRAIAAIFVVLYHCYIILDERKYWNHSWKKYFLFGHSGVEFFFVLSGIVILHAHWKDQGRRQSLTDYAWKRFRRIYPIYWVVLAAVAPVFQFFPAFGTGSERNSSVIVSSIALVHIFENKTILTVAWTLYHEVMFYFVFAFIILRRTLGYCILGIWMSLSLWALLFPPASPLWGVYTSPLHLLFGFGMFAIWLLRTKEISAPYALALLGAAGFIATCVHENVTGTSLPMTTVCYGAMATLCALGSMELERLGKLHVPSTFAFLGDASYSIYLVHFPALSVMAKLLYPLWLRWRVPLVFPFLILAVASIGVGVFVHMTIERPLLKLVRTRRTHARVPVTA